MPDFSRPEYASYVQLCRELRLKRPLHEMPKPFKSYQDFASWDQLEAGGRVYSYGLAQDFDASVITERADPVWLPTLADWLEMLEAKGSIGPSSNRRLWFYCLASGQWWAGLSGGVPGRGPTREEAAARLWMAVAKPALRGH